MKCHQFAYMNPEIVFPGSLDIDLDSDVFPSNCNSSRTGGVVVLDLDSPSIRTKNQPCGLSHQFRVK